ncbi:hypothetical protein [Streptomyces ardesiacus]|uniref:hypothetical protein n=1 Tax=Streptomyces ardesiacus TaxID=285564 RepID=UPI0036486B04
MNKHKNHTTRSNGFGIQKDIFGEEAVILLRITNPRRLNTESLGKTLMKFLQGGYKTLVLDQGRQGRVKMTLIEFLGRLQATFEESRYWAVERRLKVQMR